MTTFGLGPQFRVREDEPRMSDGLYRRAIAEQQERAKVIYLRCSDCSPAAEPCQSCKAAQDRAAERELDNAYVHHCIACELGYCDDVPDDEDELDRLGAKLNALHRDIHPEMYDDDGDDLDEGLGARVDDIEQELRQRIEKLERRSEAQNLVLGLALAAIQRLESAAARVLTYPAAVPPMNRGY